MWSLTKDQRGFSVVEALLAAAVFGFLVTGLIGAIVYGRASTADAGDHQRAALLAEEGIEATRNIGTASFANLVDNTTTNVGDTTIEAGSDTNINSTSAFKVTTGATGGIVGSVSVYITTVDPTNKHVQVAIYADAAGAPGVLLDTSPIQIAAATSWNTFPMAGVTVTGSTNYWIGLSMDGNTSFADGSGGVTAYDLSAGYPASNPFSVSSTAVDKPSFYMTVSATYGLAQVGNQWAFSGTSDVSGIYTRQVSIATASTNRKTIISTVTWPTQSGRVSSVTLTSRLDNWAAATKLWSNAIAAGSANATGTTDGLRVATAGNYAYEILNTTTNNFVVVNISNPAAPTVVSTTTFSGTPTDIVVNGGFAYVTTTTNTTGLEIINISNPAAPTLTKAVSLTGAVSTNGVYVSGGYAYLTRSLSGAVGAYELMVVNVAVPASAVVVGGYDAGIQMNQVYVSGNFAYVATASTTQEMVIVNVTVPANPTLTGTYNPATALGTTSITGSGNTIFLGMSTTLDAINVATPASPVRLGTFTAAGTIGGINLDITGQYAFLGTASTTGELQVVNVASPAAMTLAKTVDVTGTTSTITGVSYARSLDAVVGASALDTGEAVVFTRN
ncbi:MAG TPA: hypothetical protein VLH86_02490 [Patescibacteria group bacterium]|nr:hypothetical protein [Patescibacteria group bacterium]